MIKNDTIDLKLKIVDKAKRKALYAEQKVSSTVFEAILFPYNLNTDTPEKIADELIGKNYIFDDDKKFVIQSIKDRVRALNYEIIDRQAGVYTGNGRTIINQAPQQTIIIQQQQQQQQQQHQTTPLVPVHQATNVAPVTAPTPSIIQQTSVEQQPIVKPVVATEPTPITQLSELSPNVPGSPGSLQVLEEALKKTFNKNNGPQGTNTTSTLVNDPSETSNSLINQDDALISKPGTNTTIIEQQPTEESGLSITSEPLTSK
jgi:hypothetical protein